MLTKANSNILVDRLRIFLTISLVVVSFLFLSCKSATDIKYNDMNYKLMYMKMGYQGAISCFNNMLDKQTDITLGRKYIHKEDINLTSSEIEKLNAGITYVEFIPSRKDIADANTLINKINNVKPLVIKTDSICNHAISFYMGRVKLDRLNQVVKHSETIYAIMDKDFEEIKKLDKEIKIRLDNSLKDFLIQNNKDVEYDSAKDSAFFSLIFPTLK